MALEKVYGRHRAEIRAITGVYKREVGMTGAVERVRVAVEAFEAAEGRRLACWSPRSARMARPRPKGYCVGIRRLGLRRRYRAAVCDAGRSRAPGGGERCPYSRRVVARRAHLTLVPELKKELAAQGRDDIMIVVGGVVPPQDYDALMKAGCEAIFRPAR